MASAALTVGHAIKESLKRKELTQDVLSSLAGLDRTHYSKIERGLRSPNIDSLFKILAALDIKPHELMIEIERYVSHKE
ncbi:MAG: helix-turn-helix transcriptional regulator [Oscillibacter sp.]|nr:helix-turn-helix transcriptional regulator [Oscillibacter sp.]